MDSGVYQRQQYETYTFGGIKMLLFQLQFLPKILEPILLMCSDQNRMMSANYLPLHFNVKIGNLLVHCH